MLHSSATNISKNSSLAIAKKAKNDEFYTQYVDIDKEISAYIEYDKTLFEGKTVLLPCDDPDWSNFTKYFIDNFKQLGLKRLISTSIASKVSESVTDKGKILIVDSVDHHSHLNPINTQYQYLQGDGDFRSHEVSLLRDEADIIMTNPPFSLFREFLAWIMEGNKQFAIIGNMNAITYKQVFPLIKDNQIWLGISSGAREFLKPCGSIQKMGNTCWFTNIQHGKRHEPLSLMSMDDNLKFNKQIMNHPHAYQPYDNYNAIEVPRTSGIPSDYQGVMGVPISFLDKYNPDQFEIVGCSYAYGKPVGYHKAGHSFLVSINQAEIYKRIFIRLTP